MYRSQATAGFEADRWRLMVYNRATGTTSEIARDFDLQVEEAIISPDENSVYFTAVERGKAPIYKSHCRRHAEENRCRCLCEQSSAQRRWQVALFFQQFNCRTC